MRPALLFLPIKGSSVVVNSDAGKFLRQACETTRFLAKEMRLSGCSKMTLESWLSLLKSLAQPMRQACDAFKQEWRVYGAACLAFPSHQKALPSSLWARTQASS